MIETLTDNAKIDLHLHSNRSDGVHSPDQLLQLAAASGLDVLAVTDHDLSGALKPGVHEVGERRIHVIGGAEISGQHNGRELHLLAYFPGEVPAEFQAFCRAQCLERAARYSQALHNLGMELELDLDAARGNRALTRLHLAEAMVEAGMVRSKREAFARYIGDRHDNVPSLNFEFLDAIALVRRLGGLTSWAHPTRAQADAHIETFAKAGLQGIEGIRPMMASRDRAHLRRIARRYGLFLTGGSDFHGYGTDQLGLFRLQQREVGDFIDALKAA